MNKIVSVRLSDDIYMMLDRMKTDARDKTLAGTIKRLIIDSMNSVNNDKYHCEVLDRLARIELNTSVLKTIEFSN
jgi:hypothetical protein